MKNHYRPVPCGCIPRPKRPAPPPIDPCRNQEEALCPHPGPYPPEGCGSFLMQRILAYGRVHCRHQCCRVSLSSLPSQAMLPVTVLDASVCGQPRWENDCCADFRGARLKITIPLSLRLRDGQGCIYTISSEILETLPLRLYCPQKECWRGQTCVQAAVRLSGRPVTCGCDCCQVPLEILLEGYILAPCTLGRPAVPCPPALPLYPEPIINPYAD